MSAKFTLLDLPDVALEKIFYFISYDEIAKDRLVCRKFDQMGQKLLNRGFLQVEKRHGAVLRRVKSMLPRRESERRLHQLARHCDILTAIETRISMLNMTFSKYIEWNVACFIPGKVLDEIERVLSLVESASDPPRTHELLQELRDISSMAMEHFDEHIIPIVRKKREATMSNFSIPMVIPNHGLLKGPVGMVMVQQNFRKELNKVANRSHNHKHQLQSLRKHVTKLTSKIKRQSLRLASQSARIREQEERIAEQRAKIVEQENTMAEIKRHMEEWDQKFADLTAELSRSRDMPTSPTIKKTVSFTPSVSPPKIFKSNIKPRMAQVYRPAGILLANIPQDLERKRKASSFLDILPSKVTKNSATTNCVHENDFVVKSDTKSNIGKFFDLTLESFIKAPISSIKARKRKYINNM